MEIWKDAGDRLRGVARIEAPIRFEGAGVRGSTVTMLGFAGNRLARMRARICMLSSRNRGAICKARPDMQARMQHAEIRGTIRDRT